MRGGRYNPWGLVWLFEAFNNTDPNQVPQLLSDHPANGTRIQTLQKHFRDNPGVFAKFNPDPSKDVRWGDQTWEEMMIGFYSTIAPPAAVPATPQP